jgi:glutathione S-transferase
MVQLIDADIRTREVLDWKGLHVFHHPVSSCSQKLRIFLNMKGVPWHSHPVDLFGNENLTPYFLGINPRGLVPVLVDDGAVHIESNDILLHIEERFPEPRLIPPGMTEEMARLLRFEDDLHLDLRTLSFRFLFAPPHSPKSDDDLDRYATTGSGTVGGEKDAHIDREIGFWKVLAAHGITDDAARASAAKFHDAFAELETRLAISPYLLGDSFSLLDIAWIVYTQRLRLSGYPLERLHPRLGAWLAEHAERPEIAREITLPHEMAPMIAERQQAIAARHQTLEEVCFA